MVRAIGNFVFIRIIVAGLGCIVKFSKLVISFNRDSNVVSIKNIRFVQNEWRRFSFRVVSCLFSISIQISVVSLSHWYSIF